MGSCADGAQRSEKVSTPERPALLMTIDSDAICIAMCNNAPVTVELSRIWKDKTGQQYFSSGAARKARAGAPLVELIDVEMLGGERTDTLMRVAMVLIAGQSHCTELVAQNSQNFQGGAITAKASSAVAS